MGDTMGHKHQLQKSVKNHNDPGSSGLCRPGTPRLRDLNYNTRHEQQTSWQRSKGEDRVQAFFLVSPGRASSGTGVFFPVTASYPPTKKSEIRENDLKKKSKTVETPPKNTEVEAPIDSLEKLLPEEWTY